MWKTSWKHAENLAFPRKSSVCLITSSKRKAWSKWAWPFKRCWTSPSPKLCSHETKPSPLGGLRLYPEQGLLTLLLAPAPTPPLTTCQFPDKLRWQGFSLWEDSGPFRVGLQGSGWTGIIWQPVRELAENWVAHHCLFNLLHPFHTHRLPLPNAKHKPFHSESRPSYQNQTPCRISGGEGECNQVFLPPNFFKMFLETIAFFEKLFSTYKIFI